MNQADLERVGNANLRPTTTTFKQRQLSPQKRQQDHSPSNILNLQSKIGNLNDMLCSQCHDFHHDSHAKCTKMTKTKWDTFAPYMFNKLTKDQKDQIFLQLYDDYRHTKGNLNQQLHKIKRLNTKIHTLQQQLGKAKAGGLTGKEKSYFQEKEKDNTQMKQQIKRLHQKILALTGNKHKLTNNRPSTANKNQKKIIPVNQNIRQQLESQRKHVRQLLLIIDELKKNKFEVQEQLKNKQANMSQVNRSVVRNQPKNFGKNTQSQFQQYATDLLTWKQKYSDLQMAYNRMSQDKDKKIRELAADLITVKQNERMKSRLNRTGGLSDNSEKDRLQQKIRQITNEKEKLESQLRKLVQMPFYQNNKQIIDAQDKITILQIKYQKMKSDLAKTTETSSKYFAQLQLKTRQNALLKTENEKVKKQVKELFDKQLQAKAGNNKSMEIDYDDYYRKKLALVKLQGNDPVWKQFDAIAKPQLNLMDAPKLKALAQKLWLNKLELLGHLQKTQVQLKTLREGMDSRINFYIKDKQILQEELKVARARLDEWKSMDRMNERKPFKVYEQAGIKYDDTISVFETEQTQLKQLDSNQNYFDLYIGNLNIDESQLMKNTKNKVKNTTHFISFLTIDFYNHETQHSNFAQGVMKRLGNNYSFKVEVNTYFLKYLSKNSISVELWSPQGTATVLLGKGEIYLVDLINKAAQDISTVVRGKAQIYNQKMLIATVQYRFRMRLPISPYLEWAESKKQIKLSDNARDIFSVGRKNTLQITIESADSLPVGMSAFVYFTIQQQDYFTQPERGPTPQWNFKQTVQVTVDNQFVEEMKQNYFKFTIFDDEKQVNEDVYGIANANFTPLVQGTDSLDLAVDIQDRLGTKRGKLKVSAKWLTY